MIYLDSSAVLKLVFIEAESAHLERWISDQREPHLVTSEIARVELTRACRRLDAAAMPTARAFLDEMDLIPLTSALLEEAGNLGDPMLRSLDAIHLASALSIADDVHVFIAYDHRLSTAATQAGLNGMQPGVA